MCDRSAAKQLPGSIEVWRVRISRLGAITGDTKGKLEGGRFMERANGLHFLLAPNLCQLNERDGAQRTLLIDTA